jgi:hypothetical protein
MEANPYELFGLHWSRLSQQSLPNLDLLFPCTFSDLDSLQIHDMLTQLNVWSKLSVTLPGDTTVTPNAYMPTMITTSSHVKTCPHLRDSPSLVLVPLYAWASSSSRWDPRSHLAPDSNTTWHALTTIDPHRNMHLDTMTTHRLDADSTHQIARPWLLDIYSPGRQSWRDSRHCTSAPSLPSMIILIRHLADDNALAPPLCRSAEHDHPSPCRHRRTRTRYLHPVAPPTDNRPPRGASKVASNLWPCSDTNCWNRSITWS